jgi:ABC-type phosphate transport system substrate-binding protein
MLKHLPAALALFVALVLSGSARAEGLYIIANDSVNVPTPVSLKVIATIYLLRITTWPDGTHIVPVNREATAKARTKFTADVLHEDNATLAAYWNEMHFMGKEPPVVQEPDQAVLTFVQKVPGSVGYISAKMAPVHVKVLAYVP